MLVVNLQIIILIVAVSLFFGPNSAFANDLVGPEEATWALLFLISLVVVPIALVHLGMILLRSFKPSLWKYIHSNRFLVIELYFLGEVISWFIFFAVIISLRSLDNFALNILAVFLVILLISIGGTLSIKHHNDNNKARKAINS